MSQQYKIYILLQQLEGVFGKVYQWFEKSPYNHASIGFEGEQVVFYSFRSKWGFCIEHPFHFNKQHKPLVPCQLYVVTVNKEVYDEVVNTIRDFRNHKHHYYSYVSLCLGFLRFRHDLPDAYYCSKFVAEILKKCQVFELHKDPSVFLPSDFIQCAMTKLFEGKAGNLPILL